MGYKCDFCSELRSVVYCRSDAASLCLSCDRKVHSANPLSKRHSRTLICDRCNLQPASVRCLEERVSLCQNCDWTGHNGSTWLHKRQTISCYTGCPSDAELSCIWSFSLNLPSEGESACEHELGLMSITEKSSRSSVDPKDTSVGENANKDDSAQIVDNSNASVGSFSLSQSTYAPHDLHPANTTSAKLDLCMTKALGLYQDDDDDIYAGFNMDEMDLDLENYEELFGVALNHSEELFGNGGIDSLFGPKSMSAAAEGCSNRLASATQQECSNMASTESMMSAKTDSILCLTSRQSHSNISFSGLTGESSPGDFQDCGASSLLLMGEPPWFPPGTESSLKSANRSDAMMRYKEKKKMRKFEKRVRYASRKARADVRRRVKGRFIKAGDDYDYDPQGQTK